MLSVLLPIFSDDMLPCLEYERHLDETYVENQCENVCPLQQSCKLFIVEPDILRLTYIYLPSV